MAFLVRPGKIELREARRPSPSKGEVLVRVKAALTCGTDLKAFQRGHPMIPMPGPFGHEFSGVVEEAGPGVRKFSPGQGIMAVHSAPCLKCPYCKDKAYNLCENIMEGKVLGAFSEYVLLPRHVVRLNAYPKPSALSFEEAAFLEPLSCVVHGIRPLGAKRGSAALVLGAGPIGLLHMLVLKKMGLKVTVSDTNESRLKAAKRLGGGGVECTGTVAREGPGFHYVFECTGVKEVWESSAGYAKRGGTVVLFGGLKRGQMAAFDSYRLHYDEITLRGVFHFTPGDVRTAYGLLGDGKIKVAGLISGRLPLGRLDEAFGALAKGKGIKYAIIP